MFEWMLEFEETADEVRRAVHLPDIFWWLRRW